MVLDTEQILTEYRKQLGKQRVSSQRIKERLGTARVMLRRLDTFREGADLEKYITDYRDPQTRQNIKRFADFLLERGVLNFDTYHNRSEEGLEKLIGRYLRRLRLRGMRPGTLTNARQVLGYFERFLSERNIRAISDVTTRVIAAYVQSVYEHRSCMTGKQLAVENISARLGRVRDFFRYLAVEGEIDYDPAKQIVLPKNPRRLHQEVLSVQELALLEHEINLARPNGQRDLLAIELMYAAGLRISELLNVTLEDIDLEERTVLIRNGKGGKDRTAVFSESTRDLLRDYLAAARPRLLGRKTSRHLVLNSDGEPFVHTHNLTCRIASYARKAGLSKKVTAHTLRHTFATHMLVNEADIRHIQALMGHTKLRSTQVYTRVIRQELRRTIERYHPMERGVE